MRAVKSCFIQMLLFLKKDAMLFASCIAPVLMGFVFRFGIPVLEGILTDYFRCESILAPYYVIFDIFFSMMTPFLFCFVAAMIILQEKDDGITGYLCVTPLQKYGYLSARLALPGICAFIITVLLFPVFKLTEQGIITILFLAVSGALQGLMIALLIVTLSSNKLEGMAVTKLSTVTILGIFVPFFISDRIQYVLFFLPSFWTGKAMTGGGAGCMLLCFLTSVVWIFLLVKRFGNMI